MSAPPDRVAPQNLDAEEAVLGALLLAGASGAEASRGTLAVVTETGLQAGDFYRESHGRLLDAIASLVERGKPCDVISVDAELVWRRRLEDVGGRAYVHELARLAPASANAATHARLVHETAVRRRQYRELSAAVDAVREGELSGPQRAALLAALEEPVDHAEAKARTTRTRLSQVQPRAVRELLPGQLLYGDLNLVAGVGGLGKSTFMAGVAARLTREELGEPGNVILVSYEDGADRVLRPRVEAAQGDLERVFTIDVPLEQGGVLVLPHDLDELEGHVRDVEARLLVVDPIVAAMDVALDAHKDQHVRVLLARLAALAEDTDCAVAIIAHLNKNPSSDPYLRISGSVAFYNAARSVLLVTADPEERDTLRLITQVKANYRRLAPVQRYRLEEILLDCRDPVSGEPIVTTRVIYVEDADDVDRNDVLGSRRPADRHDRAVEFLKDALSDGDWHESARLKKLAAAAGISERSLQRASQELDVEHKRDGFPGSTWWRLPQSRHLLLPDFGATGRDCENPHG